MFTRRISPRFLSVIALVVLGSQTLFAQTKIDLQQTDTLRSVLERQTGQVVELRMTSGEKIGGKVEKVNDELVYLTQLTGSEFFEAAVDLNAVAAVIVREKK